MPETEWGNEATAHLLRILEKLGRRAEEADEAEAVGVVGTSRGGTSKAAAADAFVEVVGEA